jgi:hypothetical protein
MTALRATFYFDVGGLLVSPSLLGTSQRLVRDEREYVITLPESNQQPLEPKTEPSSSQLAALFPHRAEAPELEGSISTSVSVRAGPSGDFAEVHTVRVDVLFAGPISAADFADDPSRPKQSPSFNPAYALLREAAEASIEVLEDLLGWCRAAGRQPWLGIGGQQPRGIGSGSLTDLDANRLLPVAKSFEMTVFHRVQGEQILDATRLNAYLARTQAGETPPLGDVLRMDANYFLQHAEPPDPRRALLMATIACELQVKGYLRQRAEGTPAETLIEALIGSRPPHYPAHRLFDEPMKTVCGISMKEDDPDLFDAVGKLFTRRNKLAHRGVLPDEKQATEAAIAAKGAFTWLEKRAGTHER